MQDDNVFETITSDLIVKIREVLADGIARTLVYSAIAEHNSYNSSITPGKYDKEVIT